MAWRSGAAGRSLSLCVAEDCDNCQAAPLTPEPDSWLEAMLDQGVLIKRGSTPLSRLLERRSVGVIFLDPAQGAARG